MRQKRLFLILVLAVLSGAVAGLSILQFLRERPTRLVMTDGGRESTGVVVATRDMGLGHVIGEEDLRVVEWPGNVLPEGYARTAAEVVGRSLVSELRTNEPVLERKLADGAAGVGLPPLIPEGMRALSVRVDDVVGVAGFVTPQTRVDVILTMAPNGSDDTRSQVILQNVPALAAGHSIQRNEEGEAMSVTVVTVLVSPEDAEKLVLASSQGRIQMALRNLLDLDVVDTRGERKSGLFTGSGRPASTVRSGAAPATTAPGIIEMYKAGRRTLISY
jgi:pilus assembly protein CpaB